MAYTAIDDSGLYFNTKLYTGTGSSLANTGVGFQPDWVWIKGRSGATEHVLTDSVRGVTKELSSDDTGAEETVAQGLTAFGSDGFTVGTDGSYNTSSATYTSWNWKAGTTSGIATNGSTDITPSAYSFNQTAGFNVFKFTGAGNSGDTVAHGLGAIPEFIIIKVTGTTHGWITYHGALGGTKNLNLETSNGAATAVSRWNNTNPDSVNITLGNSNNVNGASTEYICYAFSGKQGYSKFGEYTGNGNANGTFVFLGFKPAFILFKKYSDTSEWSMFDNKRNTFNVVNHHVYADLPNAEGDDDDLDFLSNGFKHRSAAGNTNGSSATYIYAAFAEAPFVNSNEVPCNAR
tara:strand:- start:505 stop:1545 length:1041 start_codon:yes stop_codon:yes gene_type:complete